MKHLPCSILALAAALHAAEPVDLEAGFHQPPATALPHTWWHWTADDPLRPSGLLGPVVLQSAKPIPVP